ncbi:glycosyltransferase [Geoalkalibacter subterraneus]|uniref:Glycosyl transferase family 1 n=1 Tax=Geoalkalibacter subterraneus TaxID=483547 RepID=A0A0B5FER7_9BACT|nr:glycosyltransferase [Geoalkalibacter subterraneus]AJF06617.1 glycosyl transferase family 1 [Geoalkalibacter subterraneus]
MKICMFTNTYLPHVGGVARSVSAFAEDLRALGHDVMVIAPIFPGVAELKEERHAVLRVPAIQNFNGTDFSVRLPLPGRIHRELDEFQPDIIHSHHPFLLGDAALRTASARELPLVFTHHTLYERYTHYVPFDSPMMQRFAIHLSTRYANLCQLVIAPSESLADLIRRRGVATPCRVVPTGVDVNFLSQGDGQAFRQENHIPGDAFVIGHLGRLAPEKNLAYLARAAAAVVRENADAWFLVAGSGPAADQIKEIFTAQGCDQRLVHVGQLQGDALRNCYAAMDLFVFSSTSETQGLVLVETMASGNPVIALDASGVREVLRDRENGRLLPTDAPESVFSSAIEETLKNPEVIVKYSEQARRTAHEFSRQSTVKRLEEAYRSVLETTPEHNKDADIGGWDAWLRMLKSEWNLVGEKTGAVIKAIRSNETTRTDLK